MSILFLFPEFASVIDGKNEFAKLDFEVRKLEEMLKPMLSELDVKKKRRDLLALVFNPHIIISEVNTPSMGHSYLGKVRIPAHTIYNASEKPLFLNFSLGKVEKYNGKSDPALLNFAREKANDIIKRKIFKLFS
jgi:hypothetical protein